MLETISIGAHYPAASPPSLPGHWKQWCINYRRVLSRTSIGGTRNNDLFSFQDIVSLHWVRWICSYVFQSQTVAEKYTDTVYDSKHVLGKIARIVYFIPQYFNINLIQCLVCFWSNRTFIHTQVMHYSVFHCIIRNKNEMEHISCDYECY